MRVDCPKKANNGEAVLVNIALLLARVRPIFELVVKRWSGARSSVVTGDKICGAAKNAASRFAARKVGVVAGIGGEHAKRHGLSEKNASMNDLSHAEMTEELEWLRRRNQELEEENDFLRRVSVYFAKNWC